MDPAVRAWLEEKFGQVPAEARVESFGALPLAGALAVWHPLDDLNEAPRIAFPAPAVLELVERHGELVGYVLRVPGAKPVRWVELGDASTDTDRFFLISVVDTEAVITWLNEDPMGFEQLGGEQPMQLAEHGDGTRLVVLASPDGNARVRAGCSADGQLACAVIEL
jgi:hypothetical protein